MLKGLENLDNESIILISVVCLFGLIYPPYKKTTAPKMTKLRANIHWKLLQRKKEKEMENKWQNPEKH